MEELLTEEFVENSEVEIIEEEIGEGIKRIAFKGILSESDKINGNRRVYRKGLLRETYNEAVARSKKSGQPIFGELEHAKDAHVNLERIAVTFPEFKWDEETGVISGKAVPTLTEAGKVVEGLAKSGFKICFSTRMTGKTKPMSNETKAELGIPLTEDVKEVVGPCKIISIDVVGTPSCQDAVSDTVYEEKQEEQKVNNNKSLKDVIDAVF